MTRILLRKRRQRGMALLLVLGTLTIMAVMLADFQDESSAQLGGALSTRDALRAEFAARSGLNLARLLIAAEPTIRKELGPMMMLMGGGMEPPQIPVWEFADQVLGAFNDAMGAQAFATLATVDMSLGKGLGLQGAGFDVDIVDEDSKVNLNTAARDALSQNRIAMAILGLTNGLQYEPLFSGRDGDGQYSDRQVTCAAILDWVDLNQDASACDPISGKPSTGSEDSFYQLLDPPYYRKNAPFDSLDELHMVRGISDDFWASFVDPDPNNPKRRNVTVWGQGKININSGNAQTMMAIICAPGTVAKACTDAMEMGKLIGVINLIRTMTAGAPLFASPKALFSTLKQTGMPFGPILKAMGFEPIIVPNEAEVAKTISTESKVFSIYSRGYVRAGERASRTRIHAVVDFRKAPPPPDLQALMALGQAVAKQPVPLAQNPPAAGSASAASGALPGGFDANSLAALLVPNTAGRVVYFRID